MESDSSSDGVPPLQLAIRAATARRQVDQEVRRSESLHRTLTANLPDTSMFLLDRDLRILVAEGEGIRDLPWVDENLFRGRMVAELQGELPSDVLAMSLDCYRGALDGQRREFEFTSNGLTFTVTAVPVHGEDGAVESALAVVRDVTQRKNAERLLAQHARQQECVARLGQFALRERELPALLGHVLTAVARTLDLEFCSVLALRRSEDKLDIVASEGFRGGLCGNERWPTDETPRRATCSARASRLSWTTSLPRPGSNHRSGCWTTASSAA